MKRVKHSDILKSDWDILIILDACRYDIFKEVVGSEFFGSVIQEANSEAACTSKWLRKHFLNSKDYRDVVYVSGNPYINSYDIKFPSSEVFYDVLNSWEYEYDDCNRIEPSGVTLDAKNVLLFARNRVIIHFLQPHYPYKFAFLKFNPLELLYKIIPKGFLGKLLKAVKGNKGTKKLLVESRAIRVEEHYKFVYSDEQIREAYKNNLISVIPYIKKIISEEKNKKIIVTSDHSEYLGENGIYGHGGMVNDFISTVPYVIIEV